MHLLPVLIPLVATFVGMAGAILSALGFARPGRMPRPRRMVNYRVHYDDALGTRPDMQGVAELVVRRKGEDVPDASLVMIRISNEGGLDIGKEHRRPGVEGDTRIKGAGKGGGLVREVTPRREAFYVFGWTGFALLSLVAAILITLITQPFSSAPPTATCAPGTIEVEGSTAFAPSVAGGAQRFEHACPSSHVETNPSGAAIGSRGAAGDLQDSGSSPGVRATHL